MSSGSPAMSRRLVASPSGRSRSPSRLCVPGISTTHARVPSGWVSCCTEIVPARRGRARRVVGRRDVGEAPRRPCAVRAAAAGPPGGSRPWVRQAAARRQPARGLVHRAEGRQPGARDLSARANEAAPSTASSARPSARSAATAVERTTSVRAWPSSSSPTSVGATATTAATAPHGRGPDQRDPRQRPFAEPVRTRADRRRRRWCAVDSAPSYSATTLPQPARDPAHVVGRVPVQPARRDQRPLRRHRRRVAERSLRARHRPAVQRCAGRVEAVRRTHEHLLDAGQLVEVGRRRPRAADEPVVVGGHGPSTAATGATRRLRRGTRLVRRPGRHRPRQTGSGRPRPSDHAPAARRRARRAPGPRPASPTAPRVPPRLRAWPRR